MGLLQALDLDQYAKYRTGTDPRRVAPDGYLLDIALMSRPGAEEIQLDLILDYRSNVALYPEFQAYFRNHQPPLLAVRIPRNWRGGIGPADDALRDARDRNHSSISIMCNRRPLLFCNTPQHDFGLSNALMTTVANHPRSTRIHRVLRRGLNTALQATNRFIEPGDE